MQEKVNHTIFNSFKELILVLTASERKNFMKLVFLMLTCSLFEFISIGSLFPYIKIISDPDIIHRSRKLIFIYKTLHFSTDYNFIIFLGILIMGLMLFKAGIGMLNNYKQVKFATAIKKRISTTLYTVYITMPISDISKENTMFYSKYLLYDVENFYGVMNGLFNMLTSSLMMLALIVLMFMVTTSLVILSLGLLGTLVLLCVRATKRKSQLLGVEGEKTYRYLYRHVDESLKGIKDVKIFQKEAHFKDEFVVLQNQIQHQRIAIAVMANIPSVIINTFGFGIILVIMLTLLIIHGSILNLLPSLGIMALSIQRLLPGMTLIATNFSAVRTNNIAIFKIAELLKKALNKTNTDYTQKRNARRLAFNKELTIENLLFSYKPDEPVLNIAKLAIQKNKMVGFIGKSGSGKSTLIEVLLGLYPLQNGRILCDGAPVVTSFLEEYNGRIAYISQKPFILDTSLKKNIAFGESDDEIDFNRLNTAIKVSQLTELVCGFKNGIDEELGEDAVKISGGQKQRIGIARAIYSNADMLVFDESTSALDAETEYHFYKDLKQWSASNKTIIIISHRKALLEFCDQVITMEKGKALESRDFIDNDLMLAET